MMEDNVAHVLGGDTLAASAAHCLVVYLHRLGGNSLPPESAAAFAVRITAPKQDPLEEMLLAYCEDVS